METAISVILLAAIIVIAIIAGVSEAWHWHMVSELTQGQEAEKIDVIDLPAHEHPIWLIQRFCIAIPFLVHSLWWLVVAPLVFVFFHNGMIYLIRTMMVPGTYPDGFADHSETSTAISTRFFTWPVRLTCLIAGISLFILKIL